MLRVSLVQPNVRMPRCPLNALDLLDPLSRHAPRSRLARLAPLDPLSRHAPRSCLARLAPFDALSRHAPRSGLVRLTHATRWSSSGLASRPQAGDHFRVLLPLLLLLATCLAPLAQAQAGLRWRWPHPRRDTAAAPASSATHLIGQGEGDSEDQARARALEAIALQLHARVRSSFEDVAEETQAGAAGVYSAHSIKRLEVETALEQAGALEFEASRRRGRWQVVARLDRAAAMDRIYRESYETHATAFRSAAQNALSSGARGQPDRFTQAWRQAMAAQPSLEGVSWEIEALAAREAQEPGDRPLPEDPRMASLRALQARVHGEPQPQPERDAIETQRGILAQLEADRVLQRALSEAARRLAATPLLIRVGKSASEDGGAARNEAEAVRALGNLLSTRGFSVVQEDSGKSAGTGVQKTTEGARQTAVLERAAGQAGVGTLQLQIELMRKTQKFALQGGGTMTACELGLSTGIVLPDGARGPRTSLERAVGRHRARVDKACQAALELLLEDPVVLTQIEAGLCQVLPCEAR